MENLYDVAIIGAGPAGLSASVYASRYGLKNIVIGEIPGGLTSEAPDIGNWLGDKAVKGPDFVSRAIEHVKSYGVEIKFETVKSIQKKDGIFEVEMVNEKKFAKSILIANGISRRKLNVKGEDEFAGKGVSQCATCDGFFCKGKIVAVVGGGDSAAEDAVYLSDLAEKVYLIHRRDQLKAEDFWKNKVLNNPKIEVLYNTIITQIKGTDKLEELILNTSQGIKSLNVDKLFVAIGFEPRNGLGKDLGLDVDEEGYIKINQKGVTNIEGVYAAGDVTDGSDKFKQIVTAVSEGAIAVHSIHQYLQSHS